MNNTSLKFKNVLYNILDNGDIGNGWKYVEVVDKKVDFLSQNVCIIRVNP